MTPILSRGFQRAAFTLTELMIAFGIFAIGAAIVYPMFEGDLSLYARNFSLNKSNNSLRYALQMLKNDIDMAVEPPQLMNYRVSGGTGILQPTSANSAQAILVWVNLGPAYDLVPASNGNIAPASGVTLTRASATPTVQVGDRLIILTPDPYMGTGMPDNVTMDGVSMQKPGRRIKQITSSTATSLTVQLDLIPTPLPAGIPAARSAYIAREVAYVAYTVNDSNGNPVEKQLLYFPSTSALPGTLPSSFIDMIHPTPGSKTSARVLVRDLDPTPQEIDQFTNAIVQPFNFYGAPRTLSSRFNVVLPIRAVDYAHALNDRNLGGAAVNTSATEFDVYLRSSPQINNKYLLD